MKQFEVSSEYRQFYVADSVLEPPAPEDWDDTHFERHHNTLENIAALVPAGDFTARITSLGPDEDRPLLCDWPDFRVVTEIQCPSGRVGVFGWPWELMAEYRVPPGRCSIEFTGHRTAMAGREKDYYLVKVSGIE